MRWREKIGRMRRSAMAIALLAWAVAAPPPSWSGEPRLNQIQVIGTHNSYHIVPAPAVLEVIAGASKKQAEGLDYSHRPFGEQFSDLGIRQIELDVFADPKGGLFADPKVRKMVKDRGKEPGPDPNTDGRLEKPGLKILHVQDVDYRTHAPTFIEALKQVRAWSKTHPRHVPILIMVELKDGAMFGLPTQPVKFDRAQLDAVNAEILSVFDRSEVLTPDRVRGPSATIPEAIRARGWPEVDAVRGLVLFAMDNEGAIRNRYIEGHPALKDRVMFVTADGTQAPEAAWFKVNDPIKDFDRIQRLVRDGFLVRTRADTDTRQSRAQRRRPARQGTGERRAVRQHGLPRARPEVLRITASAYRAASWRGPIRSMGTRRGEATTWRDARQHRVRALYDCIAYGRAPSSAFRAPSPRRGEGDGGRLRRTASAERRRKAVALAPRGGERGGVRGRRARATQP